jgi:hypothetical protein
MTLLLLLLLAAATCRVHFWATTKEKPDKRYVLYIFFGLVTIMDAVNVKLVATSC